MKLAILQSGKRQWQIAREAMIPESRLSKYLHGYGQLSEVEESRLRGVLGLAVDRAEVAVEDTV